MVTKEKNLLKFFDETGKSFGSIDINTGKIYGARNKEIKHLNYVMKYDLKNSELLLLRTAFSRHSIYLEEGVKELIYIDRLLNAGIPSELISKVGSNCYNDTACFDKMLKDKEFRKAGYLYNCNSYESYLENKKRDKILAEIKESGYYSEDTGHLVWELIMAHLPAKYIIYVLKYVFPSNNFHNEYGIPLFDSDISWASPRNNWSALFSNYYVMTKKLGRKWDTKNFYEDYLRVFWLYSSHRAIKDKEDFLLHEDESILGFEYGDYQVICPKEPNALIEEGNKMHHCVGSYVKNVINGQCAIVFIRNKNDLDTPYITCEINKHGMGQYYLAYDRRINSQSDVEFQQKYYEYLLKNIDKIHEMLDR